MSWYRRITSTTVTRLPVADRRGARDDYEHALQLVGGVPTYDIDALVAREDTVAVVWTGHTPDGSVFRGLSLYRVRPCRRDPSRQDRATAGLIGRDAVHARAAGSEGVRGVRLLPVRLSATVTSPQLHLAAGHTYNGPALSKGEISTTVVSAICG
jgi:hypothetical protein